MPLLPYSGYLICVLYLFRVRNIYKEHMKRLYQKYSNTGYFGKAFQTDCLTRDIVFCWDCGFISVLSVSALMVSTFCITCSRYLYFKLSTF
jgi:hypothetical protein